MYETESEHSDQLRATTWEIVNKERAIMIIRKYIIIKHCLQQGHGLERISQIIMRKTGRRLVDILPVDWSIESTSLWSNA